MGSTYFKSLRLFISIISIFTFFYPLLGYSAESSQAKSNKTRAALNKMPVLNEKESEIEAALKANDWNSIVTLFQNYLNSHQDSVCFIDPRIRFLYGHASLATGSNNQAVNSFYCSCDSNNSQSLKKWLEWTANLVKKHPDWPSSHYLYGDALCRNGQYTDGKKELDSSIVKNSQYFLAFNARGVLQWIMHEKDSLDTVFKIGAIQDLITANKANNHFADIHANLGVIGLRNLTELQRAQDHFNKALKLSPNYWLALNGKACAEGGEGKYSEFQKDMDSIIKNEPDFAFKKSNKSSENKNINAGNRGFQSHETTVDQNFGIKLDLGLFKANAGLGIKDKIYVDNRGGVFIYLKDGENIKTDKEGNKCKIGTWFALNYPLNNSTNIK